MMRTIYHVSSRLPLICEQSSDYANGWRLVFVLVGYTIFVIRSDVFGPKIHLCLEI